MTHCDAALLRPDLQDADKLDVQTIADSDHYHELKAYAYVSRSKQSGSPAKKVIFAFGKDELFVLERDDAKYDLARSKRSKRGVCLLWLEHTSRTSWTTYRAERGRLERVLAANAK